MLTLWVKSNSCNKPRRVHRWRIGDNQTICGLGVWRFVPVSTKYFRPVGHYVFGYMPSMCHECFKYNYRFNSMKGMQKCKSA